MKPRQLFMGGDPGSTHGGIVCIDKQLRLIFAEVLPNTSFFLKEKNKKTGKPKERHQTDEVMLSQIISQHIFSEDEVHIGIEKMSPQGGPSAVAFQALFDSYGVLRGMAAMAGFRITLLPDDVWRDHCYGVIKAVADKNRSIAIAQRLWPELAAREMTKKDREGVCEAALMAKTVRDIVLGIYRPE